MKAGQKINMKYLIIGAGGTGGVTGYYMKKAGKDVTLIARGEHLKKIQKQGLTLEKMWDKTEENISIPATDMEHYAEHPDVIFVCVKGYSLQETIPFIKRIARKNTIVIPVLNIYGTGGKMQKELPDLLVTDGCIYVSANIKEPGKLLQHGQTVYQVPEVDEQRHDRHRAQGGGGAQQGHPQVLPGTGVDGQAHEESPDEVVSNLLEHQPEGDADGQVAHQHRHRHRECRGERFAVHTIHPFCQTVESLFYTL